MGTITDGMYRTQMLHVSSLSGTLDESRQPHFQYQLFDQAPSPLHCMVFYANAIFLQAATMKSS